MIFRKSPKSLSREEILERRIERLINVTTEGVKVAISDFNNYATARNCDDYYRRAMEAWGKWCTITRFLCDKKTHPSFEEFRNEMHTIEEAYNIMRSQPS